MSFIDSTAKIQASQSITVTMYTPDKREAWDNFVRVGKNSTFLLERGFLEYHSDRFPDCSLMVYQGQELLAVLPAHSISATKVGSHMGLTYGGLVQQVDASLLDTITAFGAILKHLHSQGVDTLVYKRIPRFYNRLPDDEIDYVLFLVGAALQRRDCCLVVPQADRLPFRKRRLRGVQKAQKHGVSFHEEQDFGPFWNQVLIPRLASRFSAKPVHSADEISLLASRFPHSVRQFSAYIGGQIVAGATVFETETVARAQYIALAPDRADVGALDALFSWLILERYQGKRWFDFGSCNEGDGRVVNHGLLAWKEEFGARVCSLDSYLVETHRFVELEATLPSPKTN